MHRNRTAEKLYGYSAAEALGNDLIELLTDVRDHDAANNIVHRVIRGESWTGQFPVKNKQGDFKRAVVRKIGAGLTRLILDECQNTHLEFIGAEQ